MRKSETSSVHVEAREIPNPTCRCGCGEEVARPENSYVYGHRSRSRKLDALTAADLERAGNSITKIAQMYATSRPTVYKLLRIAEGHQAQTAKKPRPVKRELRIITRRTMK